ncbi:MAG: hypothetical protein DMF63_03555 [Acidobacteria bacterium]|nr:MAG: hypothetical protein DMF63_03555 [Acidobacteriota bacterium]
MTYSIASYPIPRHRPFDPRIFFASILFILVGAAFSYSQISVTSAETFTVDDAPDQEVVCYGKTVIVKTRAKGVLAIGGDVIVEGRVTGDVAAVGGSIIQRDGAYIGGDVFAVGGAYRPENPNPLREEGRETVMYAGYEEEIRDLSQNPSSLFSPHFSLAFLAQRILSVLFWFVVSLGLATLAPGAVSRAIARFQLSTLKIVAIGTAAFLITTVGVVGSLNVLPNPLGVVFGMMAFVLLMLAYVFGRVALNVSVGKLLQKYLFADKYASEALAILIGVLAWTLLLSIPYVWPIALFTLFATGVGLVLTARSQGSWQV